MAGLNRRQRKSSSSFFILTAAAILSLLSFLRLFSVELTLLKLKVFADNNIVSLAASSAEKTKSTLHHRSHYGYHRPQPPYTPIKHTSHTCVIKHNTSSEQVIHLPTVVPHLILIGAQKSATSEFQVLADKHINVITPLSARKFEPHFLEQQVQNSLGRLVQKETEPPKAEFHDTVCKFRQRYTEYFNMSQVASNERSVVMEKTPAYMLHRNLPWVIDAICPWKPKILVILRDPIDRAWSQYRMEVGRNITNLLFATKVKKEIDTLIANGLLDNATMSLNDFEASLANNTDQSDVPSSSSPFVFPQNMTLESCAQVLEQNFNYLQKRKGFLIRGLYAPLLLPWVERFAADDRLMVMKFKEVFNESIVDEVLRFAGVNDTSIDEHYDDFIRSQRGIILRERKKNKSDDDDDDHHAMKGLKMTLDPTTRLYLKLFYRPFNRFLVQLLGDDWEGWGE